MSLWCHPRCAARIVAAMLVTSMWTLSSGLADARRPQDLSASCQTSQEATEHTALTHGHGGRPGQAHGYVAQALCQSVCDGEQPALSRGDARSIRDATSVMVASSKLWFFCAADAQCPRGWPVGDVPPPVRPVAIRFLGLTIGSDCVGWWRMCADSLHRNSHNFASEGIPS